MGLFNKILAPVRWVSDTASAIDNYTKKLKNDSIIARYESEERLQDLVMKHAAEQTIIAIAKEDKEDEEYEKEKKEKYEEEYNEEEYKEEVIETNSSNKNEDAGINIYSIIYNYIRTLDVQLLATNIIGNKQYYDTLSYCNDEKYKSRHILQFFIRETYNELSVKTKSNTQTINAVITDYDKILDGYYFKYCRYIKCINHDSRVHRQYFEMDKQSFINELKRI